MHMVMGRAAPRVKLIGALGAARKPLERVGVRALRRNLFSIVTILRIGWLEK